MLFAKGKDCDKYCMFAFDNLCSTFYAIHFIARVWNITTFPRFSGLQFFMYIFIFYNCYVFTWYLGEEKQSSSSSTDSSSRQMFGLSRFELFEVVSVSCCSLFPRLKSSCQAFRGFWGPHGSNTLILGDSEHKS